MTREEILNMPAGREMDALIFAKLFGMPYRVGAGAKWIFTNEREYLDEGDAYFLDEYQSPSRVPEYSTDIAAAWKIVELFGSAQSVYDVEIRTSVRGWFCIISNAFDKFEANSETAPLAICRAALLAMESAK